MLSSSSPHCQESQPCDVADLVEVAPVEVHQRAWRRSHGGQGRVDPLRPGSPAATNRPTAQGGVGQPRPVEVGRARPARPRPRPGHRLEDGLVRLPGARVGAVLPGQLVEQPVGSRARAPRSRAARGRRRPDRCRRCPSRSPWSTGSRWPPGGCVAGGRAATARARPGARAGRGRGRRPARSTARRVGGRSKPGRSAAAPPRPTARRGCGRRSGARRRARARGRPAAARTGRRWAASGPLSPGRWRRTGRGRSRGPGTRASSPSAAAEMRSAMSSPVMVPS